MAFFQATTMTWGGAKARVAAVAGSQTDPDQLILAGYALEEAFSHWELSKDWKYTIVAGADITVTAGTSAYDLPSDFKKLYSLRFTSGSPRVLRYGNKRDFDIAWPNQTGTSTPTGYILLDESGQTNKKIHLIPQTGISDTMAIYYYRRHTIPSGITAGTTASDGTTVDLPNAYVTPVLNWGKAIYLHTKGGDDERQQFYLQLAADQLNRARGEDEWTPDNTAAFMPDPGGNIISWNPNTTIPYLGEW